MSKTRKALGKEPLSWVKDIIEDVPPSDFEEEEKLILSVLDEPMEPVAELTNDKGDKPQEMSPTERIGPTNAELRQQLNNIVLQLQNMAQQQRGFLSALTEVTGMVKENSQNQDDFAGQVRANLSSHHTETVTQFQKLRADISADLENVNQVVKSQAKNLCTGLTTRLEQEISNVQKSLRKTVLAGIGIVCVLIVTATFLIYSQLDAVRKAQNESIGVKTTATTPPAATTKPAKRDWSQF